MPSQSSRASWHPAYMPNSPADVVAASTKQSRSKATSTNTPSSLDKTDIALTSPTSRSWHPAFMPNSAEDILISSSKESRSDAIIHNKTASHDNANTTLTSPTSLSWHPAFMPNSAANIVASNSQESHSEAAIHSRAPSFDNANTRLRSPISEADADELDSDDEEECPVDASPVSVTELTASNAAHVNGTSNSQTIDESADHAEEYHADHGGKHLSTMSFARTVSQEVNWGEDDEFDSEWNLKRTDTDPFESMATSNRTNSFPAVPPAHSVSDHHEEPLSRSQAEDILHEVESVREDETASYGHFGMEEQDAEDFSHKYDDEGFSPTFGSGEHDGYGDSSPADERSFGGDVAPEEGLDVEARYEEGLPLVPSSGNQTSKEQPQRESKAFLGEDEAADDDFFSQVKNHDEAQQGSQDERSLIGRKSTMQVMNALQFQPREDTHDNLANQESLESLQSSLEKATGAGLGVSKSTVLSEVLGNSEASIHEGQEETVGPRMDSNEADLASKWREALADDEFLDDDDFLPDDEAAKPPALDPAAFFGDDDEGFLDDKDEQETSSFPFQQTSPPIPAPVVGENGRVVGFDSLTGSAHTNNRPTSSSSNRYLPANAASAVSPTGSSYAPATSFLAEFSRPGVSSPHPSPYNSPATANFPGQQQEGRPDMQKAQSFAAKSKGGYTSPYDLPMDVVKPRKRVSTQSLNRGYENPSLQATAPPRSSSMYAQLSPASQGNPMNQPPANNPSFPPNQLLSPAQPPDAKGPSKIAPKKDKFFEDLPISSKPKPAMRNSASSNQLRPSQFGSPQPSPMFSPGVPPFPSPLAQGFTASQVSNQGPALIAPPRVSPYASLPSAPAPPPPAVTSRYSPAPPPVHSQSAPPPPVTQTRYSPAPPAPRPQAPSYTAPVAPTSAPPAPVLPHLPRTSSPLAHFERSQDRRSYGAQGDAAQSNRRSSSSGYEPSSRIPHLPPTRELDEDEQAPPPRNEGYAQQSNQYPHASMPPPQHSIRPVSHTPPPPQSFASKVVISPPKRAISNQLPAQPPMGAPFNQTFVPPQRSQTQSPGTAFAGPRPDMNISEPYQRPSSVDISSSPRGSMSGHSPKSTRSLNTRPRGFSQGVNYIAPTDGREADPLQRWRGAPVFVWGVGGSIVSSFPNDVPRYGLGQSMPSMMRSPGEAKVRNIKDVNPLEQRIASFPGPLKGKSKKKEVIAWLTSGIELLEQEAGYLRPMGIPQHDAQRSEERILLWKILRIFIENDGTLEGNPVVEKAVRSVLSPSLEENSAAPFYAIGADPASIAQLSSPAMKAEPVDLNAIDELRRHLLRGDREKAVWQAVDKRLWAHAMLISNTVSKDLYRQVAQEFIQKEVKNVGDNTESLAALYEIFAGNFEESIDELVTPSARAGFQMIRTDAAGPSKDSLHGLNRWRETLALVLSNRSLDDSQALHALGKLLAGYSRSEAAHICFLFARSHSVFGGVDDPMASIVLVGADHLRQPTDFDRDLEPVLLSEVFEYGISLSNISNAAVSSPHLSIYKLHHAKVLAEYGYREKALQYCEGIASSITSQTRRSPYHHSLLVTELDDLSKRLKQSPKDDNTSWISKPSIDKVSGSVWAKFNKFVAGDESDASAAGSTAGSGTESGPFARIAGGTPTISRSPSNSDIYGGYNSGAVTNGNHATKPAKVSPRYAPTSAYAPSNAYEPQPNFSYGTRRSLDEHQQGEDRRGSNEVQRQSLDYQPPTQPALGNPYAAQSYTPQSPFTPQTFTPQSNTDSHYAEGPSRYNGQHTPPITDQQNSSLDSSPQKFNASDPKPPKSSYTPPQQSYEPQSFSSSYEPPKYGGYEPPTSTGYEPPTSSSYEPPTSTPYEEPDSPIDTRPKKKSFMDDDDDDIPALKAQPAQGREKTKAEKDREADEAFRRAAEEDAKKAQAAAAAPKKGWGLTGWFGGSKKEPAEAVSQPGKPIKAKLGEASSFVYDPELKRWINKKAGADNTPSPSATPAPPKGPPRSVSGPPGANFTSAPRPGAVSAPTAPPPGNRSISNGSDNAYPKSESPMMPPPASNRSTPEPPAAGLQPFQPLQMNRQASGGSTGPPSRPGTSMSNASSIDDLLGPPTAGGRKSAVGGKKPKKGRGYVDVMGGEKK